MVVSSNKLLNNFGSFPNFCWIHLFAVLKTVLCTMMTSSNGNIFRVTGPLCGEFTGPGEFPAQRPVTRSFDVFFDLRPNKRLSKQPWGWWFETPSWSLWRQCNALSTSCVHEAPLCVTCARNIVFQHKLTFVLMLSVCVCVFNVCGCAALSVCHMSSHWIRLCFRGVYVRLSSTWWAQNGFKSAHREHKKILNTRWHQSCSMYAFLKWSMMTSSNGSIFRVTDHLCGEFTDHWWIPCTMPVTRSFDVFFDLRLNKRLSKQSWGRWFETSSRSLWRHCNANMAYHALRWYHYSDATRAR